MLVIKCIREHFAKALYRKRGEAWQAATSPVTHEPASDLFACISLSFQTRPEFGNNVPRNSKWCLNLCWFRPRFRFENLFNGNEDLPKYKFCIYGFS